MKKFLLFLFCIFLLSLSASQVYAELIVIDHDGTPYPTGITTTDAEVWYDSDSNPQLKDPPDTWFPGNDVETELYWLNALLENDITGDPYFKYEYEEVDGPKISSSLILGSNYNWEYGVFKFGNYFMAIENDGEAEINFAGINFNSLLGFDENGVSESGLSHYTLFNTTPVPEPATMLLLGAGLVGLTGIRKKFKK